MQKFHEDHGFREVSSPGILISAVASDLVRFILFLAQRYGIQTCDEDDREGSTDGTSQTRNVLAAEGTRRGRVSQYSMFDRLKLQSFGEDNIDDDELQVTGGPRNAEICASIQGSTPPSRRWRHSRSQTEKWSSSRKITKKNSSWRKEPPHYVNFRPLSYISGRRAELSLAWRF